MVKLFIFYRFAKGNRKKKFSQREGRRADSRRGKSENAINVPREPRRKRKANGLSKNVG